MVDRRFENAEVGGADESLQLVSKPDYTIDGASPGQNETTYQSDRWNEFNGYYRKNQGGTKASITKFAMWAVGKGYEADETTRKILGKIRGFGKSFNSNGRNRF